MVNLSLCMIVRDNELTIGPCLESIAPWVDEIIVVDTGSTDQTPKICKSHGANLYYFDWIDDFSAARNESIKHARGKWIFWMDSDDTIPEECGAKLQQLARQQHGNNIMGYVVQVRCPCGEEFTVVDHVKVFLNRPEIRFEGRIHEQVLMPIRKLGGDICRTDIYVVHSGSDQSEEGKRIKTERDLRILYKELEERPDHPFVHFNFAMTFAENGDYEQALPWIDRCLGLSSPRESHVAKTFAYKANCLFQLSRFDDALAACKAGRQLYPDDTELLFREGVLLNGLKQFDEAIDRYRQIIRNPDRDSLRSTDPGIQGHKCRFNLGVTLQDAGRLDDAELQWRQILDERPEYLPAKRAIGHLLIDRQRFVAAEVQAESMIAEETTVAPGMLFRAAIHEAKGELEKADTIYRKCREEFPDHDQALDEYCRFSFIQGKFETAEKLLLQILDKNSGNAAALHNLASIEIHHERFDSAIEHLSESLALRPDSKSTEDLVGAAIVGRDEQYDSEVSGNRHKSKRELNLEFQGSLDEAVLMVRLLAMFVRHGYTINSHCDAQYRFLFDRIGAGMADAEAVVISFTDPPKLIDSRVIRPWHVNKALWSLPAMPLPRISTLDSVWQQVSEADHFPERDDNQRWNDELTAQIENLPKPICLISSKWDASDTLQDSDAAWVYPFASQYKSATGGTALLHDRGVLSILGMQGSKSIELADGMEAAELFCLIDRSDVVVSDRVETLALAGHSATPSIGIWKREECPAQHLFPSNSQLHVVFGNLQKDRNRIFRFPWYIVERNGQVDCDFVVELFIRMQTEAAYLHGERTAADLQMQHWISLCREETQPVRDRDRSFDVLFREIGKRFMNPSIVETGTVRAEEDWAGAGFFTYLAGAYASQTAGKLHSVDIHPGICQFARELCRPFGRSVEVHCDDSVKFLREFSDPIDVLYLDSQDTYQSGFSEHALNEVQVAFEKLHSNSLVVIDDSPTNERGEIQGKGSFVVPWLLEQGWRILFAGYQLILARD